MVLLFTNKIFDLKMAEDRIKRNLPSLSPSFALLFLSLVVSSLGEYDPAYFRICSKDIKHEVDSTDCEKGVWLKKSIEPGCVCIRGVWAVSDGMCDGEARILVGDGHCFHFPRRIRSVKLIGDPRDPFKPSVYMMPGTLDAIYEIREGKYTPDILSDTAIIVGINPRQVAQQKDKKVCVDLGQEEYDVPVHIHKLPRRSPKQWTLNKKKEYKCPGMKKYEEHLAFGEAYHYKADKKGREEKLLVERQCKMECPGESVPKRPMGRTLGDDLMVEPTTKKRGPKAMKTMEERALEREEMRAHATENNETYGIEVNEQTLRMMHAHISPILLNISGQQVVSEEYKYFQVIRQVVEKACPNDFVPKPLLRGLMRMFRQLLWETQDSYFQHTEQSNPDMFNTTFQKLLECAENTPDSVMNFGSRTDSHNNKTEEGEEPEPPPPPERCPEPFIFAVNSSRFNASGPIGEPLWYRNLSHAYYPHLKFNASLVDFVIETAWKIVVISHYRCMSYFDGQTAIEFSNFFHQVQSFFNPRIIKRWYYKNSIDATLKIVHMIFPSYDLKRFMFGLDTCAFGTQGFSAIDYVNVWIQRPKVPMTENDLSKRNPAEGQNTQPLHTLDYSPDLPKKADMKTKLNARFGKGRRKRDASGFPLWSSTARCINEYMDPIHKRKEYNYRLPSGCLPPEL